MFSPNSGILCQRSYNTLPPPIVLLHMDGIANSTSFPDEAGGTATATGQAKVNTSIVKFGSGSATLAAGGATAGYLTTKTISASNLTQCTFEGWFYGTYGSFRYLMGSGSGNGRFTAYTNSSGGLILNADGVATTAGGLWVNSQWNHVAVVKNGQDWRLYLNGLVVCQRTGSTSPIAQVPIYIGTYAVGISASNQWNGYCDEFRITPSAVYTTDFTPPTAPFDYIPPPTTVFLAHFDGADGSTSFVDATGKTITGGGTAAISTAQSRFGGSSLYLDGTAGSLLSVTSNDFYMSPTKDYTIECWFNANTLANGISGYLLSQNLVDRIGFDIYVQGTASGYANIRATHNTSSGSSGLTSNGNPYGKTVQYNQWYHMALVREGTSHSLYFDGVKVASDSSAVSDKLLSGAMRIGANVSGAGLFSGYIDEVRFTQNMALYSGNTYTVPTNPFTYP